MGEAPSTPSVVHVVVPAHDEEDRVGRCVQAIAKAVAAVREQQPDVVVTTTLVLDRCTDDTVGRAMASAGSQRWGVVAIDAGCVGVARRRGVAHAVASGGAVAPETTWLATTDADSTVSESWLLDHLDLARHHDLVVGRVRPAPDELSAAVLGEWERRHRGEGPHVHGANLGIRHSTYLAAGGFARVREHEDVRLVQDAMRRGARWVQGSLVTTSARTLGRAPGGFSGYLRVLEGEVPDLAAADTG